MFSVEWNERVPNVQGRTGVIYKQSEVKGVRRVCNVSTWGMGSCAVATLQEWGYIQHIENHEIDKFFEWLCDNIDGDWYPMEFYFLFSTTQIKHTHKHFANHHSVKLRDRFENKSHGPNTVYLYRYSKAKDFKRVVNKRG